MKLKYNGLEPVNNIFGNWENGDIKEVPDGTVLIGFEVVERDGYIKESRDFIIKANDNKMPIQSKPKRGRRRKVRREELKDKMERDNAVIIDRD